MGWQTPSTHVSGPSQNIPSSQEPVLAALAAAVGLREEPAGGLPDALGEAVVTVVATVADAVTELEAVRQRRSIEKAAFDNVWRAP